MGAGEKPFGDRFRGSRWIATDHEPRSCSRRERGKIQREYVGGGTVGELAAKLDEIDRESRLLEAESIREARLKRKRLLRLKSISLTLYERPTLAMSSR